MKFELLNWQKELIESFEKGESVICNCSRGAGKTFMFAYLILKFKPRRVLFRSLLCEEQLNLLNEKFNEIFQLVYGYRNTLVNNITKTKNYIHIKFNDGSETKIYTEKDRKDFDWVFYNELLPQIDLDSEKLLHKSISMVTINNAEKHLQKFNCKIIESDIFDLVKERIFEPVLARQFLTNKNTFYRDWAILNKEEPETMKFYEFQEKALQKLMKQFLNTPDSKDTVLTRKNIVEMIKDLKQLGKN